jgi:hypothetical protein
LKRRDLRIFNGDGNHYGRIFMWLAIMNKALTWEMLQKRNKHGPSWCVLFKGDEESHLLIHCKYAKQVWAEMEIFAGVRENWKGDRMQNVSRIVSPSQN